MWMFTGMSIRVAQELGLHRQRPSVYTSIGRSPTNDMSGNLQTMFSTGSMDGQSFEGSSQVLLFWCVFVQDVSLANGTGRVPSIKQSEISIRLPTDHDVMTVKGGPGSDYDSSKATVFPHMVRMMLDYARSIEFLNTDYEPVNGLADRNSRLETIQALRNRILRSYDAIPEALRYGAKQYQYTSESGQAIPYMIMHLNFHLQIAFLTQACHAIEDEYSRSSPEQPLGGEAGDLHRRVLGDARNHLSYENQLYRKAIKSIVDILTIARFIDGRPLQSTFFLNQALFNSACAYVGDVLRLQHHSSQQFQPSDSTSAFPLPSHSSTSVVFDLEELHDNPSALTNLSSAEAYLALLAKTNYQFLRQAIKEMAKYYAGAGWVDAVLDQRESGIRDVDLSIVSESISTYIRLHDLRIAHRPSSKVSGISSFLLYCLTLHQNRDSQQPHESIGPSGDLMLSEDLLSSISPNFDSQAFFNEYIFAGEQFSGASAAQPEFRF